MKKLFLLLSIMLISIMNAKAQELFVTNNTANDFEIELEGIPAFTYSVGAYSTETIDLTPFGGAPFARFLRFRNPWGYPLMPEFNIGHPFGGTIYPNYVFYMAPNPFPDLYFVAVYYPTGPETSEINPTASQTSLRLFLYPFLFLNNKYRLVTN